MGGVSEKARTTLRDTEKKTPLISYVTGKQKSSKKQDSIDHSGTCYVINDCDIRKGVSVANLNAKEKSSFTINRQANNIVWQNKAIKL